MSNKFLPLRYDDTYVLIGDMLATLIFEAIDYETRGLPEVGKLVEQENEFHKLEINPTVSDMTYGWIPTSARVLVGKYFKKESIRTVERKLNALTREKFLLKRAGVRCGSEGGRPPSLYRINIRKYMQDLADLEPSVKHQTWCKLGLLSPSDLLKKEGTSRQIDANTSRQIVGTSRQIVATSRQIDASHIYKKKRRREEGFSLSFSKASETQKTENLSPENDALKLSFRKLNPEWNPAVWNPTTRAKFDRISDRYPELQEWIFMLKNMEFYFRREFIKKDLPSTLELINFNLVKSKKAILEYFELERKELKARKLIEEESNENGDYGVWTQLRGLAKIQIKKSIVRHEGDVEFYTLNKGTVDSKSILLELIAEEKLSIDENFRKILISGVKIELERSKNLLRLCRKKSLEELKIYGLRSEDLDFAETYLYEAGESVYRCILAAQSIPEPRNKKNEM